MLTWQLHDENEWRFGEMVRGAVRKPYYAEIYFKDGEDYGWVWMTYLPENGVTAREIRGWEYTFDSAVEEAEKVLMKEGIIK